MDNLDIIGLVLFGLAAVFGVHKSFMTGSVIGGGLGGNGETNTAAAKPLEITVNATHNEAVDVLARTIWGEARGEGWRGMQAAANVVMNRVARSGWPNSVKDVVLQNKQFSAWNFSDPNRALMQAVTVSNPDFADALKIAQYAVDGALTDITGGADHYHTVNLYPRPYWTAGQTPTAVIGNHVFYNLTRGNA